MGAITLLIIGWKYNLMRVKLNFMMRFSPIRRSTLDIEIPIKPCLEFRTLTMQLIGLQKRQACSQLIHALFHFIQKTKSSSSIGRQSILVNVLLWHSFLCFPRENVKSS